MLCIVFPNRVVSQTTWNEELQPTGIVYLVSDPAVADDLYQKWLKTPKLGFNAYSCVSYVKSLTGYTNSVGNARNWPRNIDYPVVGGVAITNESISGHVMFITRVWADTFEVTEANYVAGKVTTRELNKNNPQILGYWEAR